MLNSLFFGMQHSCQLQKTQQDIKIDFSNGSAQFGVGQIVSGAISGGTGTIKTIYVASGAWLSGNAAGHLILSMTSGKFQSGEALIGGGEVQGHAVSGMHFGVTDGLGVPITTTISIPSICSFDDEGGVAMGLRTFDAGLFVSKVPIVYLPADVNVKEGDHILGEVPGFDKLYTVTKVKYPTEIFNPVIDHLEVYLQVIDKK